MSVKSAIEWTDGDLEPSPGLHKDQPRLQTLCYAEPLAEKLVGILGA